MVMNFVGEWIKKIRRNEMINVEFSSSKSLTAEVLEKIQALLFYQQLFTILELIFKKDLNLMLKRNVMDL